MSLKIAWYIITTIQYKIYRDILVIYFEGKYKKKHVLNCDQGESKGGGGEKESFYHKALDLEKCARQ